MMVSLSYPSLCRSPVAMVLATEYDTLVSVLTLDLVTGNDSNVMDSP